MKPLMEIIIYIAKAAGYVILKGPLLENGLVSVTEDSTVEVQSNLSTKNTYLMI